MNVRKNNKANNCNRKKSQKTGSSKIEERSQIERYDPFLGRGEDDTICETSILGNKHFPRGRNGKF